MLYEVITHPEQYESHFERFLPCFTLLVNAVYWEARYPRFVTWAGLKRLAAAGSEMKLAGIADIKQFERHLRRAKEAAEALEFV